MPFRRVTPLKIAVGVFLVAIVILAPLMSVFNLQAGDRKFNKAATNRVDPASPGDFEGILAFANITGFNPATLQVPTQFLFVNNLENATFPPAEFSDGQRLIAISGRDLFPIVTTSFVIADGTPNKYPFDRYYMYASITLRDNANATARTKAAFPLAVSVTGAIDSWDVDISLTDGEGLLSGVVLMEVEFKRSIVTQFFSMFIITVMWVLSLSLFSLTVTIYTRRRKVEPPTIAVAGALLFALPGLRNTQPGIPVLGCTADTAGFFWNMLLIALSIVLLMFNYMIRYTAEPKPQPKREEASSLTLNVVQ
jgi:hypothetical protein